MTFKDPFQPKLFYDSVILLILKVIYTTSGSGPAFSRMAVTTVLEINMRKRHACKVLHWFSDFQPGATSHL